jgi:hypothetical protein
MSDWLGRPHLSILGGKEEDRFTQYWAELLRAPAVLGGFLKELCGLPVTVSDQISARSQVTVSGGRPDLAIRGDSLYLLFEAKVGSWLHQDQLTPYARELEQWRQRHPAGTALLFVVVPQRHMPGILQTAERELSEAGLSRWYPKPISWEQIGALCTSLEPDIGDRRLALHLAEFADLISFRLGEPSRPFTAEECLLLEDPLVARSIRRARILVGRVTEMLSTKGFSFTVSNGLLWDGYMAKYNGRSWWYGVWIDAWAKVGVSPIFLQLSGLEDRPIPPLPEGLRIPVPVQFAKLQHLVPLSLRDGVEIDVLADEQANVLWRYATEAPQTGAG